MGALRVVTEEVENPPSFLQTRTYSLQHKLSQCHHARTRLIILQPEVSNRHGTVACTAAACEQGRKELKGVRPSAAELRHIITLILLAGPEELGQTWTCDFGLGLSAWTKSGN